MTKINTYLKKLVIEEYSRQENNLTLIASEWAMPVVVKEALSSIFAEKYFEGTPSNDALNRLITENIINRELVKLKNPGWYAPGCEIYDDLSWLCQASVLNLFDPHIKTNYYIDNRVLSGSQANQSVFLSIIKKKKKRRLKVMCLALDHGGHLSHGLNANISGIMHEIITYTMNSATAQVDLPLLAKAIKKYKPDLLIYGGSACPRDWDHEGMMAIAASNPDTSFLFDGSHPAGLIAAGLNNNPFYAGVHFITMTTNKTLCGVRGAFVACVPEWAETLARAVFPGLTAGPHGHEMYAKLIGYENSKTKAFFSLMRNVQTNAKSLASYLINDGFNLVGSGTDTHMVLVDLNDSKTKDKYPSGMEVEIWAAECGIYINRNTVPNDPKPQQNITSGLRIGVGVASQRGMKATELRTIGKILSTLIRDGKKLYVRKKLKKLVSSLINEYPFTHEYRNNT